MAEVTVKYSESKEQYKISNVWYVNIFGAPTVYSTKYRHIKIILCVKIDKIRILYKYVL